MGIIFSSIILTDFLLLYVLIKAIEDPNIMVIDWHPFPEFVSFILNILIPLVVVALLLILYKSKNAFKKLSGIIGTSLSIISIFFSFYLGHVVYTKHLSFPLSDFVWWF